MKKIILLSFLSFLVISCSQDESIQTIDDSSNLTLLVNTNVYGTYTGVFSTLDANTRGTIDVVIPSRNHNFFSRYTGPIATLILENGKVLKATASENISLNSPVDNLLFKSDNFSFLYSVASDGSNPTVTNVFFNGEAADIKIAKNYMGKTAVNPVLGTFSCTDCKGHPNLTNNTQYTFNLLFASGDDGNKIDVESQIIIPGAVSSPFGSNDNTQGPTATGTTRTLSMLEGTDLAGALVWEASYLRSNSGSCNAAIGTWTLTSDAVGEMIEGTFTSNNATDCMELFINENFNSFTGAGFSPTPTTGQIDSDFISFTGFSDGNLSFGGTQISNDYTRGLASTGVTNGGIYAGVVSAGDNCLLIQPSVADFTPGTATIRVQNNSGLTFSNLLIEADFFIRNDQNRSNSITLEYSSDNTTFLPIPGVATINTPLTSTGSDLILATSLSRVITATLPNSGFIYFRISSDDVGGSGSSDEIGVDNIVLRAY